MAGGNNKKQQKQPKVAKKVSVLILNNFIPFFFSIIFAQFNVTIVKFVVFVYEYFLCKLN